MNRTELAFPQWPSWPEYFTEPHEFTVLNFTLFSTIEDFWSAKAYPLALIIAIWSGVWPYVKLLLLLIIWLCPMESSLRKKTLVILDQLGKWSFIDLYVLMMMVVSFYITIALKVDFIMTAGVDVDITEEIDVGFVIFTIMTLLNMFYSMLFLYFHEQQHRLKGDQRESLMDSHYNQFNDAIRMDLSRTISCTNESEWSDEREELSRFDHMDCFEIEVQKKSELHRWKESKSWKIYAFYGGGSDGIDHLSLCAIIWRMLFLIVCIGNIVLCFEMLWTSPVEYDIEGTTGQIMNNNVKSYSMIELANLLPFSTASTTTAYLCVVVYYMTVIVAPILISVVIVAVWLCPMNYRFHNVICHLLFPLQAWNAVDVFLVGTIAASVELEQVSEWILNTNRTNVFIFNINTLCGPDGILNKWLDEECFSVVSTLNTRSIIMIGTFVVVQWFALVYTRCHIKKMHRRLSKPKTVSIQM